MCRTTWEEPHHSGEKISRLSIERRHWTKLHSTHNRRLKSSSNPIFTKLYVWKHCFRLYSSACWRIHNHRMRYYRRGGLDRRCSSRSELISWSAKSMIRIANIQGSLEFEGTYGPHSASASQFNGSQFYIPFSNIHTVCYFHSKLYSRKALLRCKSPSVSL
jgi:hypothetical protein